MCAFDFHLVIDFQFAYYHACNFLLALLPLFSRSLWNAIYSQIKSSWTVFRFKQFTLHVHLQFSLLIYKLSLSSLTLCYTDSISCMVKSKLPLIKFAILFVATMFSVTFYYFSDVFNYFNDVFNYFNLFVCLLAFAFMLLLFYFIFCVSDILWLKISFRLAKKNRISRNWRRDALKIQIFWLTVSMEIFKFPLQMNVLFDPTWCHSNYLIQISRPLEVDFINYSRPYGYLYLQFIINHRKFSKLTCTFYVCHFLFHTKDYLSVEGNWPRFSLPQLCGNNIYAIIIAKISTWSIQNLLNCPQRTSMDYCQVFNKIPKLPTQNKSFFEWAFLSFLGAAQIAPFKYII